MSNENNYSVFKKVSSDNKLGKDLASSIYDNTEKLKENVSSAVYPFNLPSKGFWYNTKDLFLAPLTMGQVVDIESVLRQKSEADKLKMMCSIIDKSISGVSSFDLTIPDFYALCYELRLISSNDPIKIVQSINGYNVEKDINRNSININYLSSEHIVSKFDYPRMRDKIYKLENDKNIDSVILKEFFGYVKGDTPEEKISNFRSLSPEEGNELIMYTLKVGHGIDPVVKVFLQDGTEEEMEASFDPTMMFPSVINEILYSNNL